MMQALERREREWWDLQRLVDAMVDDGLLEDARLDIYGNPRDYGALLVQAVRELRRCHDELPSKWNRTEI